MNKRATWIEYLLFIVLFLVVLGFCGNSLFHQQIDQLLSNLEPSCVVGIGSASITVKAWSANDDCQKMIYGQPNFTGHNWLKLGAAKRSEATGDIICEMNMDGRRVTVRDTPTSNMGVTICDILQAPPGTLPQ